MGKKTISNIYDLMETVGGTGKLAAKLNLHQFTVDRWCRFGIPEKHWEAVIAATGASPAELFYINKKLRAKKAA